MSHLSMRSALSLVVLSMLAAPLLAQTGSVTGTVTDGDTGNPLPGANILAEGTALGDAADTDGRYMIEGLPPGVHVLLFTFAGYRNAQVTVTIAAGTTVTADAALVPGIELDPLQVTAGRAQEKVLEAPASISVINARELELEAPQSAIRALRNVTGLDIVQTGVDRHEVSLRGFNSTFSASPYVLTDYRHAGAAVIGVNVHSIMPSLPIDIARVEVVRGPGAALYGPGVDAGVIHYISKDAYSYPGITLVAGGGQRSLVNFQGRIAGVAGRRLGLKLTGSYGRANDFELEGCAEELLKAQRFSECPDPLDAQQLYIDGVRDNRFRKALVSGSAEYRFGENTSLTLGAGLGQVDVTVLSGIGTIQGLGYRSKYAQARLNSGAFFAQAYWNSSNSGDSYVYSGEAVVERSTQVTIQAQYDWHIGGDREELIAGIDVDLLSPNSGSTLHGRNESNDYIQELGAYVHSKTRISSKLDLVAALRGDFHSVFGKVWLSPRAGAVYKPTETSSFRLTYNSTVVHPSAISLFLDHVVAKLPLGGGDSLSVRGRGGVGGYTWNRNPAYLLLGAPTDLVASSMLPGMAGDDIPVGLETGDIYALMYEAMAAMSNEDLASLLIDGLGVDPALHGLLVSQMATVKSLLHPDQTRVDGFTGGQLGMLNVASQQIDIVPNKLTPQDGIKPKKMRTLEVGYKGIINDFILLAVDAYYAEQENFAGALQMTTPFVLVPTLAKDLTRDLTEAIDANADLMAALELVASVAGIELTAADAAALLVMVAGDDLPDASTPVGIVQPKENHAVAGNYPELLLVYPNFGHIRYFGADIALQALLSESMALFANLSWVSDDYFDHTETGEDLETSVLALNAPRIKLKLGGSWRMRNGLSITASGRYVEGFPMISGQYIGDVEPYFLIDLGVGYRIGGGLRADLNVSNVTDHVHREFIGAPKIGRAGTLRLRYDLGW